MRWNTLRVLTRAAARLRRPVTVGVTVGLLAPVLAAWRMPPAGAGPVPARPLAVPAAKAVQVHRVPPHPVRVPRMPSWHQPPVTWPASGAATAGTAPAHGAGSGATSSPGSQRAGTLPVWVRPLSATVKTGAATPVVVRMLPHRAATAAGVSGVIFTLAQAGGGSRTARVHVSLRYGSFAFADGGDYASRLRLAELPSCVLTTPQVPACRRQEPVASANDVLKFRLGADVSLPGAATPARSTRGAPAAGGAPQVVLAATAGASGSEGDYSATPLAAAGSWDEGGSDGSFSYSYPVQVPPVPGGLAPQITLGYDSQMVDGLTSSTNNQASWIGDGWDYSPGFIERDYQSCERTSAKTGDLCTSSADTTALSLNGATTTLVDDPSNGWHAQADNGEKIQYLTGTSNGTHDGGYWVVTDPDGTRYYFGLNQLPGYASGYQATNSAWTVPVYATSSGQPCYDSSGFSASHCKQAWRWNLDYVVDSHADAMAYYYNTETNYYAADKGTTANSGYIQGGALSKVVYGLRDGAVYGVTPAAEADFTTVTTRSDVPSSLACSSGSSCDVISPTFWSKYQLTKITTKALTGSSLSAVDSWSLSQSFPDTGDGSAHPPMWLDSITHTGQDGGSASLPPVKFTGTPLANRVETPGDVNSGYSIIDRMRMLSVTSETGGVTRVSYDTPPSACTSGNFPAEDSNTTVCYPDYWLPPGASTQVKDWFNKYVVVGVTQSNTAGGTTPVTTTYCYGSSPGCLSGGAWHYNENPLTRSSQRTWDQWRGFRTVITQTGTAPDPVTETKDTYFQGMDGDQQSGGGTSSASLTSSLSGDTVTDSNQFAGTQFQHIADNGAGGALVAGSVTIPWSSAATADQSQSSLPDLKAFMTGTRQTKDFTVLASGGDRESDTSDTHDSYGRVTSESSVPDTGDASEDTCTTTTYAANTSSWLLDLPSEVQVVAKPCGTTPALPQDAVSDTRYFYDGSTTLGAVPKAGDVTQKQLATSYNGSTPMFTAEATSSYDKYGRVLTSEDADKRVTTTAYTPTSGAEPTSVSVTDPMHLATTTTYDPGRDLPLTVTNPAGWATTKQYDALGRLTAVWTPGHGTSGPADDIFSYAISATAPSIVTTKTINAAGVYNASEQFYDSLGRKIEIQTGTPDGGRDVSDTFYDSDGWALKSSDPYYTTGAPSASLVAAPDDQVPSQTGYFYDGTGRVLRQVSYSFASQKWETDSTYGGNYTTTVPPAGGTSKTVFTDGRGLTSAVYEYHAGVPADPSGPAGGYDKTTYSYTPAKQPAEITDAAGNTWSYIYDLAGNQVSATAPDTGTSTSGYDPAGQLMSVTDARGKTISYTYDADGRKTAKYDTTGGQAENGSDELASWAYDSLAAGQPASSTSYSGGTSGTAYTEAVTGYNAYGLPQGSKVTISAGPLAGTYQQNFGYTTYADLLASTYDYAAGGLPAEQANTGYDSVNEPVSVTSSLWPYVGSLSYTELGHPLEYTSGTTSEPEWQLNAYDQQTNRLTETKTVTATSGNTIDDLTYRYNDFGNITSEADAVPGGQNQDQCFSYDYLGRLADAWAQSSSPCAGTPSQSAEAGAAAPYWNHYGYNRENDLTSVTATPASGAAATTSFSYPPAGGPQPHAVSSQTAAGPSGTATTSYSYDPAGDTTQIAGPSATQKLAWGADGKLSSVTTTGTGAGTTSYVYDASGNLLLQTGPGTATLYLPDETLVEDTTHGTVTGTRYYTLGGVTVAVRTSSGHVYYLAGNSQGTASLAIDSASLNVTRRYYDPYGNPVGAPPSSWPGNKGFVGGTSDATTGLTNLGAREYNPGTGSFLSTDAILTPYNPPDLNPYAYALDNPSSGADPTGLSTAGGPPNPCGANPHCNPHSHKTGNGTPGDPTQNPDYPNAPPPAPPPYAPWLFSPPPVKVVTRTPRVITPHQASTGSGLICGSVAGGHLNGGPCTVVMPKGGGSTAVGLTVLTILLTGADIVQLGLDPVTDGATVGAGSADAADIAGSAAADAGAAGDDGTPIYRGLAQGHHAFEDAQRGIASPGDVAGHADVYAHNAGDTWTSRLTSWTTDRQVAEGFAGKNGVILRTTLEEMQGRGVNIFESPDQFDESELLLEGRIGGLPVMRP
jgi:RHS repeat-associated protein